jgi:threonine synthase
VDFTVPTGNFGDIFAGYVAKRMGLPVRWLKHRGQRQRHPAAHAEDRHL